jgi:hypothetical protein
MVSSALWADVAIPNDNAKAESCLDPAHVLPVEKHSRITLCQSFRVGDRRRRAHKQQIAGSFAEYEKARLVSKLKGARERKRAAAGKCEGRKSHAELRPDVVTLARRLRRKRPKGRRRSLRDVAAELAQRGHLNEQGRPFSAASVRSMLVRPSP